MQRRLVLFLHCLAVSASVFDTILPTVRPSETKDDWQCSTKTLESYFDVPQPTGKLLDALLSYGDELLEGCQKTVTNYLGLMDCEFPAHAKWCSFGSRVPATLASDYSSYTSTAASWWAAHSSDAVDEAISCPNTWFDAMMWFPGGPTWLNDTIAFAGCHAAAGSTSSSAATGAVPTTSIPQSTTVPVSKTNSASCHYKAINTEIWIVILAASIASLM